MILTQTLAGDWVVTVVHPKDQDAETEVASFAVSQTVPGSEARRTMEKLAALTAIKLDFNGLGVTVQSHNVAERTRMRDTVRELNGTLSLRN